MLIIPIAYSQKLERVKSFGANPGKLKMYIYSPPGLAANVKAPLVVVLHGCFQNAKIVAKQTDWNKLADKYGFRVLYPQQRVLNNMCQCFDWYKPKQINKGTGQDYSIEQMTEYMISQYNADSNNIYITGLSAGAAMAVVEMADYPQLFKSGAVFAGGAYKSGTNIFAAMAAMYGFISLSQQHWANYVQAQNPKYHGPWPQMIIYQGTGDIVVNHRNAQQLIKQWTGLHGIDVNPTQTIHHFAQVKSLEKYTYNDAQGKAAVIFYKFKHMGHALPVYPGKCEQTGGHMTPFSANKKYFSTYWTAVDFGLINAPQIMGKTVVGKNEQITYAVPANAQSIFNWKYPKECKVVSWDKNSLTLIWGTQPGNVDLTETDGKCKTVYPTLFVSVTP